VIRRVVLGLALIGAAFAGLDCNQIFGLRETVLDRPNLFFEGCFRGPTTDPVGQGELTIILVADPEATVSLEGCIQGANPVFVATHAGFVLGDSAEERTHALVTVLPQGRPAFALAVQGQPPGSEAQTMTLVNESGFPFRRAENLARCAAPTTCADLGISVPFVAGPRREPGRQLLALAAGSPR
jgi:hypothetical protein